MSISFPEKPPVRILKSQIEKQRLCLDQPLPEWRIHANSMKDIESLRRRVIDTIAQYCLAIWTILITKDDAVKKFGERIVEFSSELNGAAEVVEDWLQLGVPPALQIQQYIKEQAGSQSFPVAALEETLIQCSARRICTLCDDAVRESEEFGVFATAFLKLAQKNRVTLLSPERKLFLSWFPK
jgi:hypothetical protein